MRAYLVAMIPVLLWAANFPATRYVLQDYSPGSIALLRSLVAVVVMSVAAIAKKIRMPRKKDLPMFALSGFTGVFLFTFLINTGARYVESGVGSFIVNSAPVFTLIFAILLLKERAKPICWVGVLLSLCGLIVIMVNQIAGLEFNIGVFLLLIAAIVTSLYNIILRGLLKTYSSIEVALYSLIPATVCMLVFIPEAVRDIPESTLSANIFLVLLGVFPAAIAHLAWAYALSRAEKTTNVTVFLYLIPFIATIIGFFWLGETLSIWSFIGGVVIIAGMVLTNTLGKS